MGDVGTNGGTKVATATSAITDEGVARLRSRIGIPQLYPAPPHYRRPDRTALILHELQNGVVGEDSAFGELALAVGVIPWATLVPVSHTGTRCSGTRSG
jgi:hypothetical protein